ncbi:MAG: NrfD/PsrC family molybdoenzyme membrane anchor subunit [Bacillota bacterium]
MNNIEQKAELEARLLAPVLKTGKVYNAILVLLAAVILWGLYAWTQQLQRGLIVTGMRDQVFWGLYISTFVFFVSISLTGTFLSAVLRITGNHWQTPLNRLAEVITGSALIGAAVMIFADMGRPERALNLFMYGRIQSPLIWDVIAITSYLVGSLIYLYLPLIPDIAICRDKLSNAVSPFRQKLYQILALGWRNTPGQKEKLEKVINIMAVLIIPVAISVHSVTAWIFAMSMRPGWDSTILAPYFVISAFLSGVGMVIIVMTIFRKAFHLEKYITKEHYSKLGWLFLALTLVYTYFSFSEILPGAFKLEGQEKELLNLLFNGPQATLFWSSIVGGILIPVVLSIWSKTRNVAGLTTAAILSVTAMWIKKSFLLVVPTLQVSLMPFPQGVYVPTWQEWSITLAAAAAFALVIGLFFRFFPAISIWEITETWDRPALEHSGVGAPLIPLIDKSKGGA